MQMHGVTGSALQIFSRVLLLKGRRVTSMKVHASLATRGLHRSRGMFVEQYEFLIVRRRLRPRQLRVRRGATGLCFHVRGRKRSPKSVFEHCYDLFCNRGVRRAKWNGWRGY